MCYPNGPVLLSTLIFSSVTAARVQQRYHVWLDEEFALEKEGTAKMRLKVIAHCWWIRRTHLLFSIAQRKCCIRGRSSCSHISWSPASWCYRVFLIQLVLRAGDSRHRLLKTCPRCLRYFQCTVCIVLSISVTPEYSWWVHQNRDLEHISRGVLLHFLGSCKETQTVARVWLYIQCSDICSRYLGSSEARLCKLFSHARTLRFV